YNPTGGPMIIRDMMVRNGSQNYGAIRLASSNHMRVENCNGQGRIGLNTNGTGVRHSGDGTTIVNPGTGYAPGDILPPVGGTVIRPPQLVVLSVDAAGAILTFLVFDPGEYKVLPIGRFGSPADDAMCPLQSLTGTGTGATVHLQNLGRAGAASMTVDG